MKNLHKDELPCEYEANPSIILVYRCISVLYLVSTSLTAADLKKRRKHMKNSQFGISVLFEMLLSYGSVVEQADLCPLLFLGDAASRQQEESTLNTY